MSTLKSLLDGIDAATTTISADRLGTQIPLRFIGPDTSPQGAFGTIYAFGDSLTDAGNVSLAAARTIPVSPPYVDGHFTNGNVWVQDLAQMRGLPAVKPSLAGGTDYAYGGAQTGSTPVHGVNPTDLPGQVAQFVATQPSPSPDALYAVWIGSNDVLDITNDASLTPEQKQAAVTTAVGNEVNGISALAAHGARDFLVLNVPDLGKTPEEIHHPAVTQEASSLSAQYDAELADSLGKLAAASGVKMDLLDTYSLLHQADANPGAYGFTNVTDPVWTGNLTSSSSGTLRATGAAQNQYLYFDNLHPTAAAHSLLAQAADQSLGVLQA
jgi:phospholipase/lecithinase/hemolysin